jgi:hypothetical protein
MLPIPAATGASGGGLQGIASGIGNIAKDILPSIISAGSSIFGGLQSNKANWALNQENWRMQEYFNKNSIRWRVRDAKAAGLHPLYALGAPTISTSPLAFGDQLGPAMAEAGQAISQGIRRIGSVERQREELDLALLSSQIAESDARREMYLSEAARNRQSGNATPGLGIMNETGVLPEGQAPNVTGLSSLAPGSGYIDVKPMEVHSPKSGDQSMVAGDHSYYQKFNVAPGMPFEIPVTEGESPTEVLENMSLGEYYGLLRRNQMKYGNRWLGDFLKLRYLGERPAPGKYSHVNEQWQGPLDERGPVDNLKSWAKRHYREKKRLGINFWNQLRRETAKKFREMEGRR